MGIREEYRAKYVRQGDEIVIRKEANPFREMPRDAVLLRDRERYLTFMGSDLMRTPELGGVVTVTLGKYAEDAHTFSFDKTVTVFIGEDMLYSLEILKVDNASHPILLEETVLDAL
jgi:hypothetical protein